MKKLLLLLLFMIIWTSLVFAQTKELYEKEVGTQRGKYPLTVTGLQNAIASLDSGVVYIAYPGIWDTTGLGAIPSDIIVNGWFLGHLNMYGRSMYFLPGYGLVITGVLVEMSANSAQTVTNYTAHLQHSSGEVAFFNLVRKAIDFSISGTAQYDDYEYVMDVLNPNFQTARTVDSLTNYIGYSSQGYFSNSNNPFVNNYVAFRAKWGGWLAGTLDYAYAFYSDGTSYGAIANNFYHFYGLGDYPAFFGGDVEIAGDKINFENIPSDSTSVTTGQIWFNLSTGAIHRKF